MSYDLQVTRQAERDIQVAADEAKRISREPNARGYVGMEDHKKSLRDENGFTPTEAAELKRRIQDVKNDELVHHDLLED